jgi:hypothetical protein
VQRHVRAQLGVLVDAQEVHVHHLLLVRVLLPVAHQHLLHLAVDVQVEHGGEEPLVLGGEQDGVVLDLDALRGLARAIDDGRDVARATQAAARTLPLVLAALGLDFVNLCHVGITSKLTALRRLGDFPATREVLDRDSGFGIRDSEKPKARASLLYLIPIPVSRIPAFNQSTYNELTDSP